MKILKYILSTLILVAVVWSCSDNDFDDLSFLENGKTPTNVAALFTVTQDNTGLVSIIPSADGATRFEINYGDGTAETAKIGVGKVAKHNYAEGTYNVDIVAKGVTGLKTEFSKELVVSFQAPEFGTEPIVEADASVSKQVNVTVPDDAQFATYFDVYFVENDVEVIISGNMGETVSYIYANPGLVDIKIVLKGGAIETTEYLVTDFMVTEILAPVESAPTPVGRNQPDYYSVFSDAYTNIEGSDFNPWWGQETAYNLYDLNGDEMLQYANLNYQGIQIGQTLDVTSMEYLHVDIWTPDLTSVDIYPLQVGVGAEDEKFKTIDLTVDQWTSIDIPLSFFTDQGLSIDQIHQFKFVGENSGTIFVDNIYFYKSASEFATLPINFESAAHTFEAFLDAEFAISVDPDDANNPVGMITNHGVGWGWEGVSLGLDEWIDTSIDKTLQLDFYNDGAAHTVLLKLEDSTSPPNNDGNPTVFEEVWVDVSNTGWSELTFDFTKGGKYDTVVLFVDGSVQGITGTYYFDNVRKLGPVLPITFNSSLQTFEAFLDAEFALSVDPDDANNPVGMITNHGVGWGWEGVKLALDEWVDTSIDKTFKLDFYNDGLAHTVLLKLEDSTSEKDGNGNPLINEEVMVDVSNTGWSQLSFDFTKDGKYDTLVLFVDGGVEGITGTYYFDNVIQPTN